MSYHVARHSRGLAVISWTGPRFAAVVLALLSGCNAQQKEEPAPKVKESQVTPSAPAQHRPVPNPHGNNAAAGTPAVSIVWDAPSEWKVMPQRMMRKATYQAQGKAGPAEIAVFYFGQGQGGDVETNMTRWVGQFQDLPADAAARSTAEVNGFIQTTVSVERGTYAASMPGAPSTPQKDWAMLATIVQTPSGQYFFKMTGPADTVAAQRLNFQRLLASVGPKAG
jgi:hypothetical protein